MVTRVIFTGPLDSDGSYTTLRTEIRQHIEDDFEGYIAETYDYLKANPATHQVRKDPHQLMCVKKLLDLGECTEYVSKIGYPIVICGHMQRLDLGNTTEYLFGIRSALEDAFHPKERSSYPLKYDGSINAY